MIIEYPFSRTTGPVIGAFLTGLREQVLLGIKGADGTGARSRPRSTTRSTGEDLTELVEVGPGGVVDTWAWVRQPDAEAPARSTPSPGRSCGPTAPASASSRRSTPARSTRMSTGMRVVPALGGRARGHDPRPRVLGAGGLMADPTPPEIALPPSLEGVELVRSVRTPAALEYEFTAGVATTRFLKGITREEDPRRAGAGRQGLRPVPRRRPAAGRAHRPSRSRWPTSARSPASAS